ncbi:MAG: hypothetical protein JSW10_11000 [Pseudomonadota bacterium]|nr:MAG: hypothetical protein JSW10_11000 [Pseudomonadota bacterium]
MNTQNHTRFHRIGTVSALVLVLSAAGTFPASAGWFDGAADKVRSKTSSTAQRVVAAPKKAATSAQGRIEDIKDKVTDMSRKLNEMYGEVRAFQPMMDRMRNGPLMEGVGATIDFLEERQHDYQQFAGPYAETFRQDIQGLFGDLQGVMRDFPAFANDDAGQRLSKVIALVDRMPVQFLYLLEQAIGPQLPTLRENVDNIRAKLAELPDLPRPRDLLANPLPYEAELCELVTNKRTATHVATVQALLKTLSWGLKSIKDLTPTDLEITVNAVAGAGTSIATHPARVPFHVLQAFIVDGIDLAITNYVSIATSMCQVRGQYDPNQS